MERLLGIDFISVLGMPPVEHVRLAARLGCCSVSLAPAPFTDNPYGYPEWSLRETAGLRRDLMAALADTGVRLALGEGFLAWPGAGMMPSPDDLDLFADLGCEQVNLVVLEPDPVAGRAELAKFARLAAERALTATFEFMPGTVFGDFGAAYAAWEAVADTNLKMLVDCMHFARSGSMAADLAACDPAAIGYLQLCDAPATGDPAAYGEEAKHNRLVPGEGELPLKAIVSAIPRDVPAGLELPRLAAAKAGLAPRDALADAVAAARGLLECVP